MTKQYSLAQALASVSGKSKAGPKARTATHTRQTKVRSKRALGASLTASGDEGKAARNMRASESKALRRGAF